MKTNPAKCNHHNTTINGPRPSPLKILNKASNSIRKQQRQPVIIYTQSPKIIYTQAKDFMALVQTLTGLSSSIKNDPPSRLCDTVTESSSNINCAGDGNCSNLSVESPKNRFKLQDSDFTSPNVISLLTPSFMEFMKRLT